MKPRTFSASRSPPCAGVLTSLLRAEILVEMSACSSFSSRVNCSSSSLEPAIGGNRKHNGVLQQNTSSQNRTNWAY